MPSLCAGTAIVKNTFIDISESKAITELDSKSWSCPSAFFHSEGSELSALAAIARASSQGRLTREALEEAGHLSSQKTAIVSQKLGDADVSSTEDVSSSLPLLSESMAESSCGAQSVADSIPETEFDWPLSPLNSGSEASPRMPSLPVNVTPLFPESPTQSTSTQRVSRDESSAKGICTTSTSMREFLRHEIVSSAAKLTSGSPPTGAGIQQPSVAAYAASTQVSPFVAVPSQPVQSLTWFRVASRTSLKIYLAPSLLAPWSGFCLHTNETFASTEESRSMDGLVYLRLSDGRGWVLDDTALNPHEPSIRRGNWASTSSQGVLATLLGSPCVGGPPSWNPTIPATVDGVASADTKRRNRRRKRGGVHRRSKNRGNANQAAFGGNCEGAEESESEQDDVDCKTSSVTCEVQA